MENLSEYIDSYTDLYYSKMNENEGINNIVVVYSGRFQPFGVHHLEVYNKLKSEFSEDNVYIVTSNKTDFLKSPLNFEEKKRIINKHGIKNVVNVKNTYVANELLSKFDDRVTGVVYVVSDKDDDRLKNSDYYLEYNGSVDYSYKTHAYVYRVPTNEVNVDGNMLSGTYIRRYISDNNKSIEDKVSFFEKAFGFYDENIFKLVYSKFNTVDEVFNLFIKNLDKNINEDNILVELNNTSISFPDDGPDVFFGDFKSFKNRADKVARSLGFDVIDYITGGYFSSVDPDFGYRITNSLSYFPKGDNPDKLTQDAIDKWVAYVKKISLPIGYKFYDFLDSVKDLNVNESDDTSLISRAKNELILAGLYDSDSDYNGELATSVMELIQTFTNQNHSGYSAMLTSHIFNTLVNGETLTPITSNKNEWEEVGVDQNDVKMWQNKRNSSYFSFDKGKTYWSVNESDLHLGLLEDYSIVYNENDYLFEGGLAGHIKHPFEDMNLTFMDLKNLILMGFSGDLQVKLHSTEKIDGINLYITIIEGKVFGARNKGELKNPLSKDEIISKFSKNEDLKYAFEYALRSLEKFINTYFSEYGLMDLFGNGSTYLNIEIFHPKSKNVIDYDKATVVFHNFVNVIDNDLKTLDTNDKYINRIRDIVKNVNFDIDDNFELRPPVLVNINSENNFSNKKQEYVTKLKQLMSEYNLSYENKIEDYVYLKFKSYVINKFKNVNYKFSDEILDGIIKWLMDVKSKPYTKKQLIDIINDDYIRDEIFLIDRKKMFSDAIYPIEILVLELGVDILKNVNGFLNSVDQTDKIEAIQANIAKTINIVSNSSNIDDIKLLSKNLEKLNSIGGLDSIIPTEGIVFKYKDKMYKITGAYSPLNKILGILKYKK